MNLPINLHFLHRKQNLILFPMLFCIFFIHAAPQNHFYQWIANDSIKIVKFNNLEIGDSLATRPFLFLQPTYCSGCNNFIKYNQVETFYNVVTYSNDSFELKEMSKSINLKSLKSISKQQYDFFKSIGMNMSVYNLIYIYKDPRIIEWKEIKLSQLLETSKVKKEVQMIQQFKSGNLNSINNFNRYHFIQKENNQIFYSKDSILKEFKFDSPEKLYDSIILFLKTTYALNVLSYSEIRMKGVKPFEVTNISSNDSSMTMYLDYSFITEYRDTIEIDGGMALVLFNNKNSFFTMKYILKTNRMNTLIPTNMVYFESNKNNLVLGNYYSSPNTVKEKIALLSVYEKDFNAYKFINYQCYVSPTVYQSAMKKTDNFSQLIYVNKNYAFFEYNGIVLDIINNKILEIPFLKAIGMSNRPIKTRKVIQNDSGYTVFLGIGYSILKVLFNENMCLKSYSVNSYYPYWGFTTFSEDLTTAAKKTNSNSLIFIKYN